MSRGPIITNYVALVAACAFFPSCVVTSGKTESYDRPQPNHSTEWSARQSRTETTPDALDPLVILTPQEWAKRYMPVMVTNERVPRETLEFFDAMYLRYYDEALRRQTAAIERRRVEAERKQAGAEARSLFVAPTPKSEPPLPDRSPLAETAAEDVAKAAP